MTGLTEAQRVLLDQRRCEQGHRIDGYNYPTPEGICPRCANPEVLELTPYTWLLAESLMEDQPRASLHPSVMTGIPER